MKTQTGIITSQTSFLEWSFRIITWIMAYSVPYHLHIHVLCSILLLFRGLANIYNSCVIIWDTSTVCVHLIFETRPLFTICALIYDCYLQIQCYCQRFGHYLYPSNIQDLTTTHSFCANIHKLFDMRPLFTISALVPTYFRPCHHLHSVC